jgi:hypothetical protein
MEHAAPTSRVGKIASYVDLVGLTDMALADLAAAAELDGLVSDAVAALDAAELGAIVGLDLDPTRSIAEVIGDLNAALGTVDAPTDVAINTAVGALQGLAEEGFETLDAAQTDLTGIDLAGLEQAAIDAQTTEDAALEAAANKSVDVSEPTIADALRDFAEMLGISRFND